VKLIIPVLKEQNKIEEKRLIHRLINGDEPAFEVLFYRYRGKVSNFIKKSIPATTDLEETVHEVFLRIWIRRENLDINRPFEPYLFKVARNLIVDELRKNIENKIYLEDGSFKADLSTVGANANTEERELQDWFNMLLRKLPPKRREIFEMSRFEDLSYREIASKLNVSENTVDTQIRRTLSFFRQQMWFLTGRID